MSMWQAGVGTFSPHCCGLDDIQPTLCLMNGNRGVAGKGGLGLGALFPFIKHNVGWMTEGWRGGVGWDLSVEEEFRIQIRVQGSGWVEI
jgi:hypothetical protein